MKILLKEEQIQGIQIPRFRFIYEDSMLFEKEQIHGCADNRHERAGQVRAARQRSAKAAGQARLAGPSLALERAELEFFALVLDVHPDQFG